MYIINNRKNYKERQYKMIKRNLFRFSISMSNQHFTLHDDRADQLRVLFDIMK